ncbi:MAG: carboxypeptidase regulatory-like domain-containing protein [Krumholzibacteria bacterium]|nr:carboxypeptidase regulatory-like domain-containing protein [Candidatus Krumholzibacteria bacterium]
MKREKTRLHHFVPAAAVLACLLLGAGCFDSGGPGDCPAQVLPALSLKVLDAETLLPAACGARVWAMDGDFVAELEPYCDGALPDSLQYPFVAGPEERAGTYTVLIAKDGYEPWSRAGIVVKDGVCNVETVNIEVLLVRAVGPR